MKFVLLVLLKSWDIIQRYIHSTGDMTFPGGIRPCCMDWKGFSSAFEITLKSSLHFIQPKPGSVGLILPALSVHRSQFSTARSPEQCDPYRELQQGSSLKGRVTHWQDLALWWERFALVLKLVKKSQDRFPAACCWLPAACSGSAAASSVQLVRLHTRTHGETDKEFPLSVVCFMVGMRITIGR